MGSELVRRTTAFIPDMYRLGLFIDELVPFPLVGLRYGTGGTECRILGCQI